MNLVINITSKKNLMLKNQREWLDIMGYLKPQKFQGNIMAGFIIILKNFRLIMKKNINGKKKHLPNLTGTKYAYTPKNVSENFGRNKENDEYKPWTPT
jgi:hypothetical protein